jgi:hypothetical protein
MIAALSDDEKYRIVWFRDAGVASASSDYQVEMNKGQAFSLVSYDSTYLWAVGRAVDDSSNEE